MTLAIVDAQVNTHATPNLMEGYTHIRNETSAELPNQIQLDQIVSSSEDCSALFEIALDLWKQNVTLLNSSHDGMVPSVSGIKQLRKFGLILRTAYRMFDQSHDFPDDFGQLIYEMGQVTDIIRISKVKSATIPPHDPPLQRDKFFERISALKFDFTPSTPGGFYKKYYSILDRNIPTITKENLSLEELHDMRRKCLRHISNVFQLASLRTLDPTLISIFNYLHSLDKELGDYKDVYEEIAWSGVPVGQLVIPTGIIDRLELFITRHNR